MKEGIRDLLAARADSGICAPIVVVCAHVDAQGPAVDVDGNVLACSDVVGYSRALARRYALGALRACSIIQPLLLLLTLSLLLLLLLLLLLSLLLILL